MDGPGEHHPEWGNTITKELTQYVLTDKWILAQNLGYPRYKIQFPKHMKLKKNEDWSVDSLSHVLSHSSSWWHLVLIHCVLIIHSKAINIYDMDVKWSFLHFFFLVNSTWEYRTADKELPPSHWSVATPVRNDLFWMADVEGSSPLWVVSTSMKKIYKVWWLPCKGLKLIFLEELKIYMAWKIKVPDNL